MPPLSYFAGGAAELPIVISLDATGFDTQQFNMIAMRNPYLSRSAQHLRVFGLGNCSDDRAGSTRLLGPNLGTINEAIQSEMVTCMPCEDGELVVIRPRANDTDCLGAFRSTLFAPGRSALTSPVHKVAYKIIRRQ